jgi:hypothetical protein
VPSRKARWTRRAAVRRKDDEELQKNNLSNKDCSETADRPTAACPHKSLTRVLAAMAHYIDRVAVLAERAMGGRRRSLPRHACLASFRS